MTDIHRSALPFVLRRKEEVLGRSEITSTAETIHRLLLLEDDRITVQWRLHRASDLRAFEPLAGQDALRSTHPGEIVLQLRRGDDLPGREFAAEIALASAHRLETGRQ